MEDQKPIIVRKIKRHHKPHGGAWKVAFADFATAMMAFFLVLWLNESTTEEQKKAMSGYFKDPVGFQQGGNINPIDLGGRPSVVNITIQETKPDDQTKDTTDPNAIVLKDKQVEKMAETLEQKKLKRVMEQLQEKIDNNRILSEYKDQIKLDITKEGLRIQIVDKEKRPMFDSGSEELKFYSEDILTELASSISQLPNKISISGHTDSTAFTGREDYSNWELSAGRANAARRALMAGGVPNSQIARVVGLADSVPYDKDAPDAPINRRISITMLNKKTEEEIQKSSGKSDPDSAKKVDQQLQDLQLPKALGLPDNIEVIGDIKRIPAEKSAPQQEKNTDVKPNPTATPPKAAKKQPDNVPAEAPTKDPFTDSGAETGDGELSW